MMWLFAAMTMAIQSPTAPVEGSLAFDCALNDAAATVAGKPSEKRRLAFLSSFGEGSGAVREAYDPTNLLAGSTFSTLTLAGTKKNPDSYQFILRSGANSARPAMLTVMPNGEPKNATQKNDFVGVFGFTDEGKPTQIGKCVVAGGLQAIDLFNGIHAQEAKQ